MEQCLIVFNIIGLILGLKLLYNFESVFKNNKSLILGNIDIIEITYTIIVFSTIGNLTFLTTEGVDLYQVIGGLASCFIHPFLHWVLKKTNYGHSA